MQNGKIIKRTLAALLALCLTVTTLPAALFASAEPTGEWKGDLSVTDASQKSYVESPYATADHWTGPENWSNIQLTPIEDANPNTGNAIDASRILTVPATFVDYGATPAEGRTNRRTEITEWNADFVGFNQAIQKYHIGQVGTERVLSQAKFKFPLYFGTFGLISDLTNLLGSVNTENNAYAANPEALATYRFLSQNPGFIGAGTTKEAPGNTAILGMVGNTLDAEGRLMSRDGAVMPYFDYGTDGFLRNNPDMATVYSNEDLSFPFVRDLTQPNRYVFDSSTGRNNVRVTKDERGRSKLTFDSGKSIENWTQNEVTDKYGFFPFNDSFDEPLNFGFGMRLDIPFTLDDANNSYFYFSGDDDVWVYVDGVLMLDLGGVRSRTGGYINFGNAITVQDSVNGQQINLPAQSSYYTGATFWPKGEDGNALAATTDNYRQLDRFYHDAATLFDEEWTSSADTAKLYNKSAFQTGFAPSVSTLLQNAGYTGDALTQKTQALFPDANDSTQHTLTVFYMERGLYDSNLHIEFTFNPIDLTVKSGLTVQNEMDYQNVNEGLRTAVAGLVDANLKLDYELARQGGTAVSGGSFTLAPDKSKNFNREDTTTGDTPRGKQYTLKQTMNGVSAGYFDSTYSINPVEGGNPVKNAHYENGALVSDGKEENAFTYPNGTGAGDEKVSQNVAFVNRARTTDVTLSKALEEGTSDPGVAFGFKVTFSKMLGIECSLPFTGSYTVDGNTYTSTDGVIYVPAGQTAVLNGIPVGSEFTVIEENASGLVLAGSTVTGASYEQTDGGVCITTGEETASVAVTFTNRAAEAAEYYGQVGRWVYLPLEGPDAAAGQSATLKFDKAGSGISTATQNGFSALRDHEGSSCTVESIDGTGQYGVKMEHQNQGFLVVPDETVVSDWKNAKTVRVTVGYYVPDAARENSRFGFLFDGVNREKEDGTTESKAYVIRRDTADGIAAGGLRRNQLSTVSFELSSEDAQAYLHSSGDRHILVVYWNYNDNASAGDYMYITSLSVEAVPARATVSSVSGMNGAWKTATDDEAAALGCPSGSLLYKAKSVGDDDFTVTFSDGSVKPVVVHNYQTRDQLYVLDYGLPVGLTGDRRGTDTANYTGNGGDATVTLVYATADTDPHVAVNVGNTTRVLTLPTTGGWSTDGRIDFSVNLSEATEIRFTHEMLGFNIREIRVTTQAGDTTTYTAAEATRDGTNATLNGEYVGNMHLGGAWCSFDVSKSSVGARLVSGADTLNFFGAMPGTPEIGDYAGRYTRSWKDRYGFEYPGTYGELVIGKEDFTASKYTPQDFMNGTDTFVYGMQVTAAGKTASDATNATPIMQGSIKFVPASNIYYEDDFGVDKTAITYIGDVSVGQGDDKNLPVSSNGSYLQDNDKDTVYGYDDVYFDSRQNSAASANNHVMRASSVAAFRFEGTGFDLYGTTENRDVTLRVFVYDAATVEIDGATGTIKAKDGQMAKLEAVTLVNTLFKNGVNDSGSQALTNVPVIALRNLPQETEHLVKVMVSPNTTTADLRFYFEGVRVYNPLAGGDMTDYADTERGAVYESLHAIILGDGRIENRLEGEKYVYSYAGTGENAKASLFAVNGNDGIVFSAGGTTTEDFFGEGSATVTTSDLLSYLMQGPNNEVYLSGGNGVAFMASAAEDANPTMQISVKRCAAAPDTAKLLYLTREGGWEPLAAARENGCTYSTVEMYYSIPVDNCFRLGDQYLIALRAGAGVADTTLFSLVNLKYKGYALMPIDGTALSALTVSASEAVTADGLQWKSLSDGRVLITFETGIDIADVRVTLNEGNQVIADQIVCGSVNGKRKAWRVILAAKADGSSYRQEECTVQKALRGSAAISSVEGQ